MTKKRNELKILLLQIRQDQEVARDEIEAFRNYGNLAKDQIIIHNVFEQPKFTSNIIDNFDALFVGGASEASVLEPDKYTFVQPSIELLKFCRNKKIPVFASCFGFQLAVIALGGEILKDEVDFEMGTPDIALTAQAKKDELFFDTIEKFKAVSVHKEKAITLPEDCELLAYTDKCLHAFKIKDAPFWAFQFHPEVNRKILVHRLGVYKDQYTENDDHYNKIISNIFDTPESNILVEKFIDRIVLKNEV